MSWPGEKDDERRLRSYSRKCDQCSIDGDGADSGQDGQKGELHVEGNVASLKRVDEVFWK